MTNSDIFIAHTHTYTHSYIYVCVYIYLQRVYICVYMCIKYLIINKLKHSSGGRGRGGRRGKTNLKG